MKITQDHVMQIKLEEGNEFKDVAEMRQMVAVQFADALEDFLFAIEAHEGIAQIKSDDKE